MAIRVLVADDTPHVRKMLSSMLTLDGFEVVAEAQDGPEAIELSKSHEPDVIILDYAMPGMNGLEASIQIRKALARQNIILYTAYLDEDLEIEARKAGVAACLSKLEGLETLEKNISELCLTFGAH